MNSITIENYNTKKRHCPHQIQTKIRSVELFRQTHDVEYVVRKYHISKVSLYRRNKQYDGTHEPLENKSHIPKTPPPNAHFEQELKWIRDYCRRNSNISVCELYGKLREDNALYFLIRSKAASQQWIMSKARLPISDTLK